MSPIRTPRTLGTSTALQHHAVDCIVSKDTLSFTRGSTACRLALRGLRESQVWDEWRSCEILRQVGSLNLDATRPGNEHTERATLTINSRSRLLDLEASKRPSGGDGSIGEVCPGCASATMPAWSQPRRRIPRAVATEWYGDALEHIRQRRRYTSLCCGILCRCADNSSSLVERHSGARVTEERACR